MKVVVLWSVSFAGESSFSLTNIDSRKVYDVSLAERVHDTRKHFIHKRDILIMVVSVESDIAAESKLFRYTVFASVVVQLQANKKRQETTERLKHVHVASGCIWSDGTRFHRRKIANSRLSRMDTCRGSHSCRAHERVQLAEHASGSSCQSSSTDSVRAPILQHLYGVVQIERNHALYLCSSTNCALVQSNSEAISILGYWHPC